VVLLNSPLQSQFYETGQDPFSVSWKQIRTKNYKLIFPADFEKNARLFATVVDSFYPVSSKFLLKKHKPVSVVFHTRSSLSNGLVVYAPKRMELYTIPPQDNYPQDWLDQLALHETRHVVQLDALNQGLTRIGSFLIGQQAVGAASGLVPRWAGVGRPTNAILDPSGDQECGPSSVVFVVIRCFPEPSAFITHNSLSPSVAS
jgi:hypothetical protein